MSQISGIYGGTRVMKMMYEYARVEQIHSLSQCPERWAYPLHLLLSLKKIDIN
jgi:hypothetical protein